MLEGNKKEDVLLWPWMVVQLEDVKEKGREEKKKESSGIRSRWCCCIQPCWTEKENQVETLKN